MHRTASTTHTHSPAVIWGPTQKKEKVKMGIGDRISEFSDSVVDDLPPNPTINTRLDGTRGPDSAP